MTPRKWFTKPRRNSSPTRRAALNEFMNISSSQQQQRSQTFPPSHPQTVPQQRAPMLITSSFYNQEYPFEIYDSSAAEEEEIPIKTSKTETPVVIESARPYQQQQQNFVQEPLPYVSQPTQNINIPSRNHHDDIYYREPYRATNERPPTPYNSERYSSTTAEDNGKTFFSKDLADFEKLQHDFKKLEKKHKKKEKKIQELEYLLYSKSLETKPVAVPKPNRPRLPMTPNNSYSYPTRSFDYNNYYDPYYGYGSDYYYSNHTPSSYHYYGENRHTNSSQHRYSFDTTEENDDYMVRNYYLQRYYGRRPTT